MSGKQHWRVAAATAAGASHLRDDIPNQDAVAHRVIEIGDGAVAAIAVADGAGSAPRSDEGSRIAVATAVAAVVRGIERKPAAAMREHLATSLVRYAVKRAKNEVVRYARRQSVEPPGSGVYVDRCHRQRPVVDRRAGGRRGSGCIQR